MICVWKSCALLLLLNSSCGPMRYTRRERPNQDHHTESLWCSCIMSTSEKNASKKAKTVDNEFGTTKCCTGTSVRVARVDFFSSCCCCTTWTIYSKVRCTTERNITYIAYSYILWHRVYAQLLLAGVRLWKNDRKSSKTKPRCGTPRLTDKNAALVLPSR